MVRDRLRVACVGAGFFSRFHCEAWRRMDDVELVALCERDEAAARRLAAGFGVGAVFADAARMIEAVKPDLLDIVTGPASHFALIRDSVARGVATVCQKPFCSDLAEAEAAVGIARAAGTPLIVHENFRFQPWYRECRELIRSGALGDVLQAAFRLRPGDGQGPDAYLDRQPYFRTMERFLVHETAIHFIDTFRFLFGEVVGVYASLRRLNPAIAGEDAGYILFDHASGVCALFDGNRLVDHAARNRRLTMGDMLIEGTAGVLRLDGDGRLWRRAVGRNDEAEWAYRWDDRQFGGDCVFRLQRHVVDGLRRGGGFENEAGDYVRNLAVEAAVYRSARAGARIAV